MTEITETGNIRFKSWGQFLVTSAAIIIIASAMNFFHLRFDLTEDGRYTLSGPTHNVLDGLKNDIYVQVYLDGEIPIPLKRLKRSVGEMLEEFRIASGRKIDYEFINPSEGVDSKQREAQYNELTGKGLIPIDLRANDTEGGSTVKRIFPGMIVNYNGIEVPVNFLNNSTPSYEQNILRSVEGLEYEMIQTIATISSDTVYKVAFLEGQGELPEIEVADITLNLARFFTVDRGSIAGKPGILDNYAAVIVADPVKNFTEPDKFVLDQYVMNGGKVLWLLEEVDINSDSLHSSSGETVGLYHPVNIEDQLFRYGARINPEIIQDIDCAVIALSVSSGTEQKQIIPAPWLYFPLLAPNQSHPVTRNINKVKGEFANTIDTVGLDTAITKTILLSTSPYSRTLSPPLVIRLNEVEQIPDKNAFNKSALPVAVLLEGVFPSAFKNRVTDYMIPDKSFKVMLYSKRTKMIVVGDGDIIRNEVRRSGTNEIPLPLGQDKYTGEMFGNRDFLINCMNYLVDDNGLMELRSRELKLRLLDKPRIKEERTRWQIINIFSPVILVIVAGFIYSFFRKRIYTHY